MGSLKRLTESSVGAKMIMALTGLALFLFVITHLLGNMTLLSGRETMNSYAAFLQGKPALLWTLRLGLLLVFVLHVTFAIRLSLENSRARPEAYRREDTLKASWASRHMLLSGLLVGAFLVYHLLHFTLHAVPAGELKLLEGRPDVYGMVVNAFSNVWVAGIYIVANSLLGLHLVHGSSSLFQSMGWDHPVMRPIVHGLAPTLAIFVAAGNVLLPLTVLFGWVS